MVCCCVENRGGVDGRREEEISGRWHDLESYERALGRGSRRFAQCLAEKLPRDGAASETSRELRAFPGKLVAVRRGRTSVGGQFWGNKEAGE